MKVLLINGSPHQKGCTQLALDEIAKTIESENIDTEILWIGKKPISGCIGCNKCLKDNKCFINDEVNEIIEKVTGVDGLVIGSPVHFASATGAITSFLDRVFYGRSKLFERKAYASVVSCRRGGATAAFDQLNKYALISNMYVVGSTYWNQIHGTKKEEAIRDLEGLQTMRNLGKNMAYLIKSINTANIEKTIIENTIKTNFIS